MELYVTSTHDLFSDAFMILNGRLMFASLYGRDVNVLSLMGLLTGADSGLDQLGFRLPGSEHYHPVNTTARHFFNLQKRMTKLHTHNYGVLSHVFLHADDLVDLNRESRSAWVVWDDPATDTRPAIWSVLNQVTDIPLLDEWADAIIERLDAQGCLVTYQPGITAEAAVVGIKACRINLPEDFDCQISTMLKSKRIN